MSDTTDSVNFPGAMPPASASGVAAISIQKSRDTSTSQAFYPQLPEKIVQRSMLIAAAGSAIGFLMYGVIQGTVINFFLEDLNLKERIPWFTGLYWLAGIGSIPGSWIQEHWGHRRALMISCCGLSRLTWLVMGLLPLIWPELIKNKGMFWPISACYVAFYFIHSIGANAWIAWMSDLVPPAKAAKFWSLRQVATYTVGSLTRFGMGYYLEQHREMRNYAIIFAIATIGGVLDVSTYFFVAHREPALRPKRKSIFVELWKRLQDSSFRKFCGIYLCWLAGNCIMGSTVYYFMRDLVGMGPFSVSWSIGISIVGFAIASVYWGWLAHREGHARAVIVCLIVQNASIFFYWMCGPNTTVMVTLASTLEQIGLGGVTLFMWPMLIEYTKGKGGGRAVGMSAFTALLSVIGFAASLMADRHLYNGIAAGLNYVSSSTNRYSADSGPVYLGVMVLAFALRLISIAFALSLPPCEAQQLAGPGTQMLRRMFRLKPARGQ